MKKMKNDEMNSEEILIGIMGVGYANEDVVIQ